jgi:predicted transcriptional regulator
MAETDGRRGYGDLAQAILDVVGQAAAPVIPAQVRDALDTDLAYTTVMTVMARLHGRGLLARQRVGRGFAYTAVTDPTQVTARRMHRILNVEQDRAGVLARFVDGLTPDDGRVLRGLLDRIAGDRNRPAAGEAS